MARRKTRSLFERRSYMQTLVAVADTGSMSRAAERLYSGGGQPAVSRTIRLLEEIAGAKLFQRREVGRHGLRPTLLGIIAAHRARMILEEMDDADRSFTQTRDLLEKMDAEDPTAPRS